MESSEEEDASKADDRRPRHPDDTAILPLSDADEDTVRENLAVILAEIPREALDAFHASRLLMACKVAFVRGIPVSDMIRSRPLADTQPWGLHCEVTSQLRP